MPQQRAPLPEHLGGAFSYARARRSGVGGHRLELDDLEAPFRGTRLRRSYAQQRLQRATHPAAQALEYERLRAEALAARELSGHFFSHRTAALLWGAPLPMLESAPLHLSVFAPRRAPRVHGVHGHSLSADRFAVVLRGGIPCTTPATTWAALGHLPLAPLVAVGDYFVRVFREGYGRPIAPRAPYATRAELAAALALGRWPGAVRLRRALELVREDAWSPMESVTRVHLVLAGLPEPVLNADVCDERGQFLACLDMAYPQFRVGIEYHGRVHAEHYARDLERQERLKAAGWHVLQVGSTLIRQPERMTARVRDALVSRGWRG